MITIHEVRCGDPSLHFHFTTPDAAQAHISENLIPQLRHMMEQSWALAENGWYKNFEEYYEGNRLRFSVYPIEVFETHTEVEDPFL